MSHCVNAKQDHTLGSATAAVFELPTRGILKTKLPHTSIITPQLSREGSLIEKLLRKLASQDLQLKATIKECNGVVHSFATDVAKRPPGGDAKLNLTVYECLSPLVERLQVILSGLQDDHLLSPLHGNSEISNISSITKCYPGVHKVRGAKA